MLDNAARAAKRGVEGETRRTRVLEDAPRRTHGHGEVQVTGVIGGAPVVPRQLRECCCVCGRVLGRATSGSRVDGVEVVDRTGHTGAGLGAVGLVHGDGGGDRGVTEGDGAHLAGDEADDLLVGRRELVSRWGGHLGDLVVAWEQRRQIVQPAVAVAEGHAGADERIEDAGVAGVVGNGEDGASNASSGVGVDLSEAEVGTDHLFDRRSVVGDGRHRTTRHGDGLVRGGFVAPGWGGLGHGVGPDRELIGGSSGSVCCGGEGADHVAAAIEDRELRSSRPDPRGIVDVFRDRDGPSLRTSIHRE